MLIGLICRKLWIKKTPPKPRANELSQISSGSLPWPQTYCWYWLQSSWCNEILVESCKDKECPGARVGSSSLWPVQEPRRLHKAVIQSTGALSLTQTLSKTFLTGILVEGVTQLQVFVSLFPREQQHSGLIIKQHWSSEFEKVPWFFVLC